VCVCGKQKGRKRKSILHHFGYDSFCDAVGVEEIAENDGIRMVSLSLLHKDRGLRENHLNYA